MTSSFSQLWSIVAFPTLTQFLGETVVYTPQPDGVTGTPITFTAPFAEKDGTPFERENNKQKVPRLATVECPLTVNNQAQTYGPQDTFLILGTLWKVDKFGPRDAAQVTVHLKATGSDIHLARQRRH
jgi:hypothetical protein